MPGCGGVSDSGGGSADMPQPHGFPGNSRTTRLVRPKTCFKCKKASPYAPSRDGPQKPYCQSCFRGYVEQQIREAFFRSCGVPTDESVIICVSGGPGSAAVAHVAAKIRAENLNRGGQGKIVYHLTLLHLSEENAIPPTCLPPSAQSAATEARRCAERVAEETGLALTVLPMIDLVEPKALHLATATAPTTASLASSSTTRPVALSGTDREDLFELLRRDALINAACALGGRAVVFGTTGTTCAWRGLGEVVRGRGADARTNTGYHGLLRVGPQRELFLFRPCRGVLAKEAALFCRSLRLSTSYLPTPFTGAVTARTMDRHVERFVLGLEGSFRSTVFNILNSVDKFGPIVDAKALARGTSTVSTTDERGNTSGRKALKQHLHQVIRETLLQGAAVGTPASQCGLCACAIGPSDVEVSVPGFCRGCGLVARGCSELLQRSASEEDGSAHGDTNTVVVIPRAGVAVTNPIVPR